MDSVVISASRKAWWSLLAMLAAAAVLVLGVCAAFYLREAHTIATNSLEQETRRTDRFTFLFGQDIGESITDLRLLVTGDGFDSYIATGQPADLERAVRRAVYFSRDNPDFDQIRYIDEKGWEVFRVNHNGVVVPQNQLQDKSSRPFFQKTNGLNQGEIFVSRIDLNEENGEFEQPLKPMIRVATPVFDPTGHRRGIYVVNVLVQKSIDRLKVLRFPERFRLLNSNGYWLAGEGNNEWGFELPGRAGDSLAKTHPDLWAKILRQPAGQERLDGGYFTWTRVAPTDFYPDKPVKVVAEENFLVFGSVIPGPVWKAQFLQVRQTFVMLAALVLILTTSVTWFFHARRMAAQERDRFFNLTRDLLCVAGFDGYFKRVNSAWTTCLGYTEQEIKEAPFVEFVHRDDRAKTMDEMGRLRHGNEVLAFENRYRAKDGSYRWLLWSARPLAGERLIYASARDMTERKQIEEKLTLSEERLRLMIESVADYAIFMLDPAGRVITWNAGAQRINGYAAEEIIGKHFSIFHSAEPLRARHTDMELMEAAEKGRYEEEGVRVRKDGTEFWANVVINAMRNAQGELVGFVKVVRDITARRAAEARIQKLNEELQQRAALLEAANKELESFSYSVSHDLRAPLRHVHGFVELLQRVPALEGDASAQRYMGVIAKAAKEMGHLIDDLLAFSRTGRAEMHPAKIKMRDMVEAVIRETALETEGRKIIWEVKPLPDAAGDPPLLRLVWVNLLGNAVKYTRPREEARIEIGEWKGDRGQTNAREVVYYVRDNGVGFDMRYASKLFGVFQRLHRSEDFEGTGIGLANVQRIILRHGGRVWAEAKSNAGATFYFSLPINS